MIKFKYNWASLIIFLCLIIPFFVIGNIYAKLFLLLLSYLMLNKSLITIVLDIDGIKIYKHIPIFNRQVSLSFDEIKEIVILNPNAFMLGNKQIKINNRFVSYNAHIKTDVEEKELIIFLKNNQFYEVKDYEKLGRAFRRINKLNPPLPHPPAAARRKNN